MDDDARDVADVLDPAPTVAGVEVSGVRSSRRGRLADSGPGALAPCRLTKRQAREMLDRIADGARPVVVTARVERPGCGDPHAGVDGTVTVALPAGCGAGR